MSWKHELIHQTRPTREREMSRTEVAWEIVCFFSLVLVRPVVFFLLLWLSREFALHVALHCTFEGVPSLEELHSYSPLRTTVLYDRNGEPFTRFFMEDRVELPLSEISSWMPKAVVAAEDARFPSHGGVSLVSILRAALENRRAGNIRQGGSTITQQLARNMFLSHERTMERKLRETIIAFRLENEFAKDEILEKYLNEIYFGRGAWGVETASRVYFGKRARNLSLGEAALLTGLIPSPNRFNPGASPEAAEAGKRRVLARMSETGVISDEERMEAEAAVALVPEPGNIPSEHLKYPYFAMRVLLDTLLPEYGVRGAYGGGLHVFTTLDRDLQEVAERIASSSKYQLALVGLDAETGGVRALVGGRNWAESQFDRAVQAYRQPGSAFKPLVYAALFEEKGWRSDTKILDTPLTLGSGRGRWSPKNYDGKYHGSVTVESAIIRSLNVPAVRAFLAAGKNSVVKTVRGLGITTPHLPENPTMALGSASLTPLEMAVAFSVFANGGYRVSPFFVREIRDDAGNILFATTGEKRQALSEHTANGIRNILIKTVSSGTGRAARIEGFQVFGKTGTTNDFRDAWFVGGIPGFCAVVYVGNDDRKPLGQGATGGKIAAPLWREFVAKAAGTLASPATFPKNAPAASPNPRPAEGKRSTEETGQKTQPLQPSPSPDTQLQKQRTAPTSITVTPFPPKPPTEDAITPHAPQPLIIESKTDKRIQELLQQYKVERE